MGATESKEHWKDIPHCFTCRVDINFFNRHHCRNCGYTFCDTCSDFHIAIPALYLHGPGPVDATSCLEKKRVCKDCYDYLQDKRSVSKSGLNDFELLTIIGAGKYGKVVKAREKSTGQIFAIKILSKKEILDMREVQHTIAERNILMKINHPFLMRLHCAFQTAEKLVLVMDFVNGGELFFHLQNQKERRFDNDRARFYAAQICLGIEHLHAMGIIYRDLKPENVLLDAEGHIRLTDFGLSKEGLFKKKDRTSTFCGTPEYLAPEVLHGGKYNNAVDWWGFGALIYEMLTGYAPFYEKDVEKMFRSKLYCKIGIPEYVHPDARHLLVRLLDRNPDTRMTDPRVIKSHPWFRPIDWVKLYGKEIEPPYIPCLDTPDSVKLIDSQFTNKDIVQEIGSTDDPGIDDTADPQFSTYSYFPSRYPPSPLTCSAPSVYRSRPQSHSYDFHVEVTSPLALKTRHERTSSTGDRSILDKNRAPSIVKDPKDKYTIGVKLFEENIVF